MSDDSAAPQPQRETDRRQEPKDRETKVDELSTPYYVTANSLFSFLKQTFFKMPVTVQVIGWLTILALFVFLVLYPVVGIFYVEGRIVDITLTEDTKQKRELGIEKFRVHRDRTISTNEYGEFTLPVHGPMIPGTTVQITLGEANYQATIDIPAPVPFLSLFNPNPRTIYRVLSSEQLYFIDHRQALDEFYGKAKSKSGAHILTPSVVHAETTTSPTWSVHIRQLNLPKGTSATDVYFAVSANGHGIQIDAVPDSKSPSSRLLNVGGEGLVQIDGFNIPIPAPPAQFEIIVYSKRLLADTVLAKFSTRIPQPSGDQMARPITVSGNGTSMVYDLLPPAPIGCVGINSSKSTDLLQFVFWVDVADSYLSSVKSVQYHMGRNFSSRNISYPEISPSDKWTYSIASYAPEVIKATVAFNDAVSLDVSKLCRSERQGIDKMTLFALSQAYRYDGQYKPSGQFADKALGMDPKFAPALVNKAIALAHQKKPTEAYQLFQNARDLAPDSPYVLNEFAGYVVEGLSNPTPKQLKEGLDAARKASDAERRPGNLDTLGWLYYRNGNYAEAVRVLQEAAIAQQPNRANSIWQTINYHLGMSLTKLQREVDAVEAFREVVDFEKFAISDKSFVDEAQRQLSRLTAKGGKR